MRSHKIRQELDDFHKRRQKLFYMEKSYSKAQKKRDELEEKKVEITEKNQDIAEVGNIRQDIVDFFMSKFRWLVIGLDFALAYVILSSYTEFIPYLPVSLKAFLAIVFLVTIEYIMALFQKEDELPPPEQSGDTSFAYDEQYERKILQYEIAKKRERKMKIYTHVFILILPIVSLATMFQEFGTSFMRAGLEEDGGVYVDYFLNSEILYILFKYVGLAICSYAGHMFLIEFSHKIIDAKSRLRFNKIYKALEDEIESLNEYLEKLETTIVNSLMDFHQKLKMHISRFGRHDMLPSERFSQMLDDVYLKVNGLPENYYTH